MPAPRPILGRQFWHYTLFGACMLVLLCLLVYPVLLTVSGAFVPEPGSKSFYSLSHMSLVFEDPRTLSGILNSFKIAAGTTTLATLIALPLAVLSAGYRFPGKRFFNAAVLVPLILPPFVGAIGMRALLGREGAINALLGTHADILGSARILGVMGVQALGLYPIIYLNATASLANLDPALDEAAQNLGVGFWRRFFRITLPLVRPGLFAGATIVFIWSFTELGTPLMFDYYEATPVQVFFGLKEVESSARPYALVVVMLATAVTLYMLGKGVFGRAGYAMYSKASRAGSEKELAGGYALLATLAFAGVVCAALLPHVGVLLTSVSGVGQWYGSILPRVFTTSHYREALTAADSFRAISNSFRLAGIAMLVDMVMGVVVAYILVRTRVRGRWLLDALCMLPLAVPGLVMAFGYVAMSLHWPFGKSGPLGAAAGILTADPNPIPFLVAAYAIRRLPYIVRSTVAGLEQTSGELEEAAVNLGASRLTAVRRVILPLILANLIAGGLLVFSFSMLEVSDSIILAQQSDDFPLTKAILAFMDRLGDGPYIASALGVWGMALLTTTIFAASSILGKKLGSIFRV